jgi:glycosyltransferase involved in cell wall biosynthesis
VVKPHALDITVVIPSIPPRARLLHRAIESVLTQKCKRAPQLAIAVDYEKKGAAHTRQRALDMVQTPWVAFLDDDDQFMPDHLAKLMVHAQQTGADYAYSWFHVIGGLDPFPNTHYTLPWDNANPRQTTITTLVRTGLAKEVGFLSPVPGEEVEGQTAGEDWNFTLGIMAAGGLISHLVERTWFWHHDSQNTSGLPSRW